MDKPTISQRVADALRRSMYPLDTLPVQELEAIRSHLEYWASQQNELDDQALAKYSAEMVEAVVKQISDEPVMPHEPIDGIAEGQIEGALGEYLDEGRTASSLP